MALTTIDIDAADCEQVMTCYGLRTQSDAVNFALRELVNAATASEARSLRGSGWDGDLDEMRMNHLA